MGHYLSSPNKEKVTEEGEYKHMKYAASGMQGTYFIALTLNLEVGESVWKMLIFPSSILPQILTFSACLMVMEVQFI